MIATFIKSITVTDPDTGNPVELSVYKEHAGGMFAVDASYLSNEEPVQSPFGNGELDIDSIEATYVSVWDSGTVIRSKCLYNTVTFDVTEIKVKDVQGIGELTNEYLELPDGKRIERHDFTIDSDCNE